MEVLKVWFVFACNSIAFLMGFNLIDWEVGLKIIGKIAEVFLALNVEGKLIINFMNCSWFDKQIDLWSQILIEQKREVTPSSTPGSAVKNTYQHFMENDS